MTRGIYLENEIVAGTFGGIVGIKFQERFSHKEKPYSNYCNCTCDAIKNNEEIIEVKTSEKDPPENLRKEYPHYYAQVQWQMWVTGLNKATILWCKCPPIDSGESAYNEKGELEVYGDIVEKDEEMISIFEKNAPVFWKMWRRARIEVRDCIIENLICSECPDDDICPYHYNNYVRRGGIGK
jgi:hypothetical protein